MNALLRVRRPCHPTCSTHPKGHTCLIRGALHLQQLSTQAHRLGTLQKGEKAGFDTQRGVVFAGDHVRAERLAVKLVQSSSGGQESASPLLWVRLASSTCTEHNPGSSVAAFVS